MFRGTGVDGDEGGRRWVFGLCADWCGVCRDWRAVFDAAAAHHPEDRFVWIDIEDDDELVGDLDIETFPTLLVGTARQVLFFGTILPSPELLARLLASLGTSRATNAAPQSEALLQRLVSAQL
ncbi:MAG: thioredoxin family protein [Ramlibacter sp.]|nr:thioredoxin family protein [Ramlibacter sp.]